MSKYHSRKTTLAGMTFDSKKEAQRYVELRCLERAGEITALEHQVPFELLPVQKDQDGRVIERAVKYTADFVYVDSAGRKVVEDVKSSATKTRDYILRRKLMLWRHGIRIQEV